MKMVSIKTMIAKILRDTRIKDSTYADDMLEWIPSAMGELQTTWSLSPTSELVNVVFHKAPLPCGLEEILSVTYGGKRMVYANPDQDIDYTGLKAADLAAANVFLSRTPNTMLITDLESSTVQNSSTVAQSYITAAATLPFCEQWYRDLPEVLETSLPNGTIRINFLQIPVDDDGYPLVPDNENYKEAIYYKVRQKLIEAGYPETTLKWEICVQMFEKYASRALGEIRYPSVDRVAAMNRTLTRLIPPSNYYKNFSDNRSTERYPGTSRTWH